MLASRRQRDSRRRVAREVKRREGEGEKERERMHGHVRREKEEEKKVMKVAVLSARSRFKLLISGKSLCRLINVCEIRSTHL